MQYNDIALHGYSTEHKNAIEYILFTDILLELNTSTIAVYSYTFECLLCWWSKLSQEQSSRQPFVGLFIGISFLAILLAWKIAMNFAAICI